MSKPFHELRERLLRAGVAPRHVRRYVRELADHLADLTAEEKLTGRSPADAKSAALARLGSMEDLATAMIERREFQAWCVRAPWAAFGFGPVFLLAVAYFVACFLLWAGWNIFLPEADTPFHPIPGPIYGLQNIYFQADKFYYFAAPLLVGWGIALVAVRQRVKAAWPILGLIPIAVVGGMNQVYASRTSIASRLGHIRMGFAASSSMQDFYGHLLYALTIFSLTVLPYLVWRIRNTSACS